MEEIGVEPERALYALSVAAELLAVAKEKLTQSSFEDALLHSRDSMRVASSAILFRDGFVAPDLDSSCDYLKRKYGSAIPVEEWRKVEVIVSTGPLDRIAGIFGLGRGALEKNAREALEAASSFLNATSALIIE